MMKPRKSTKAPSASARQAKLSDEQKLLSLTPREAEVLGWLIEGKRDSEIGTILSISENTVHKHAQRIYGKLGVETRTAAARLATGAGFKAREGRR